jgi:hypothetical protein
MSDSQQPNPGKGVPNGNPSKVPVNDGKEEAGKKQNAPGEKAKASNTAAKKPKKRFKIFIWPKFPLTIKHDITLGDLVNSIIAFSAIAALFISIITLRKTGEQFEKSNRPFVELGDFRVDSTEPGQKPNIRFNYYNSGKFPAKMIYASYVLRGGNGSETKEEVMKIADTSSSKFVDSPRIILSSLPILMPRFLTLSDTISKPQSNDIKRGAMIFFLSVELKYINFLTNEPYFKKELFKIIAGPIFTLNILIETEEPF